MSVSVSVFPCVYVYMQVDCESAVTNQDLVCVDVSVFLLVCVSASLCVCVSVCLYVCVSVCLNF